MMMIFKGGIIIPTIIPYIEDPLCAPYNLIFEAFDFRNETRDISYINYPFIIIWKDSMCEFSKYPHGKILFYKICLYLI